MTIIIALFVFIFGLLIGSFLNVCIYRIPREESIIHPPSHCPGCNTRLKAFDLVPVLSFLVLKGKCRYCGSRVSARYPAIELLTGLMYVTLFARFGTTVEFIASVFLMSVLIVVFFVDLEHRIIPHGLTITGLVGGVLVIVYSVLFDASFFGITGWMDHVLGILPGSGLLFIVAFVGMLIYKTDDAMGMGDVYIFAPIGIFLGWKLCALTLLIAVMSAAVLSVLLIILRLKKRKDTIPFGPFIVLGTFIAMMWGNEILSWYFNRL